MNNDKVKSLIEDALARLGHEGQIFEYFDGDESDEAIERYEVMYQVLIHDMNVSELALLKITVYLANPTMTTCCDEFLEMLDRLGMQEETSNGHIKFTFEKTAMDIEVYVDGEFTFVIDVPDVNNLNFEDIYYEWKKCINVGLVRAAVLA